MFSILSPFGHSKFPSAEGAGHCTVRVAINKDLADAAELYTIPDALGRVRLSKAYSRITTAFTGGTNAAIGCSSSNAAYATKGDLWGGAGGNLLAALTAGYRGGTVGTKLANNLVVILEPGDKILFDRVVDAFTAGAGYAFFELIAVEDDF